MYFVLLGYYNKKIKMCQQSYKTTALLKRRVWQANGTHTVIYVCLNFLK